MSSQDVTTNTTATMSPDDKAHLTGDKDLESGHQETSPGSDNEDPDHGLDGRTKDPQADPDLITWDGDDDPANPHNWSTRRRVWCTWIWVAGNLVTCIGSSIFSSGSTAVQKEFHISRTVATLGISLFLLGYTVGPPIWGPLSEKFGRKPPMVVGMTLFTIFCLPVALAKNPASILVGRFLSGMFGAAPLAIVGGGLVDLWDSIDRGVAMAGAIGSIFGSPIIAPIMGNFIAQSYLGWRWTQWLSAIMGLACTIMVVLTLPETYAPKLLRQKAARIRRETGNEKAHSMYDDNKKGVKTVVQIYLVRPFRMLATEPILTLVTIYQAFVYGILYLVFVSYPIEFQEIRKWKLGVSSLPFLGMFIGILMGCATVVYYTKTRFAQMTRRNDGVVIPEQRLPLMIAGGCLIPVGLFIFAWTSDPKLHWIGMVIGSVPLGMGMYMVFVQCLNYIVDVYLTIANSAIGANTFVRSFFGAGFPLFGPAMYHRLGVAWATSLLGFISIAMIPIPIVFYLHGSKIRSWSPNSMNKN